MKYFTSDDMTFSYFTSDDMTFAVASTKRYQHSINFLKHIAGRHIDVALRAMTSFRTSRNATETDFIFLRKII